MMVLPVTDALVIHQSISLLRGEVGAQRRVRGSAFRFMQRGLHPSPQLCQVAQLPASLSSPLRGEAAMEPINLDMIQ